MANLSIRNLKQEVYKELQQRSLEHGISMEEEVRQIITKAVAAPRRISEVFVANFGKDNGIDLNKKLFKHKAHTPLEFKE